MKPDHLSWALMSVTVCLISLTHSAPIELNNKTLNIATSDAGLSSSSVSWKTEPSYHLHRQHQRDNDDNTPLTRWSVYRKYMKHVQSEKIAMSIPDDIPTAEITRYIGFRERFKIKSVDDCGDVVSTKYLKLGNKIGSGSYGAVFQGWESSKILNGYKEVAVKKAITQGGNMINGAKLQKSIRSKWVAKVNGYFFDYTTQKAYLIMRFIKSAYKSVDLFDDIPRLFEEGQKSIDNVFIQLIAGLRDMHELDIMHRDIKPENFIFDNETPQFIDFDQATNEVKSQRYLVGTPVYQAPEIIRLQPYGKEVDIFSLGMTWLKISCYPAMISQDIEDEIYKALTVSPNRQNTYQSPEEIQLTLRKLLKGRLANKDITISSEMQELLSWVLCGPKWRLNAATLLVYFQELPTKPKLP